MYFSPSSASTQHQSANLIALGELFQQLLDLAVPGIANYQAHQLRTDGVYRAVVCTAQGFQTLSIPAQALLLAEMGMLVESDRYAIMQQLRVVDSRRIVA